MKVIFLLNLVFGKKEIPETKEIIDTKGEVVICCEYKNKWVTNFVYTLVNKSVIVTIMNGKSTSELTDKLPNDIVKKMKENFDVLN